MIVMLHRDMFPLTMTRSMSPDHPYPLYVLKWDNDTNRSEIMMAHGANGEELEDPLEVLFKPKK